MDHEKRKEKYLDKLKRATSQGKKQVIGVLDIQADNSTCFDDSHQQYTESKLPPNDLLAKVERYMKANPTSHITKGRLTVKRGFYQHDDFRSNINSKDNLDTENKCCAVQKLDSNNSFKNPKRRLVSYEPDTKIKFGTPNATSTIKHQQTQCVSISPTQNEDPNFVGKCNKRRIDEKKYNNECLSLSEFNSNNKSSTQEFTRTKDQKSCGSKCRSDEEKSKLNLTYDLFMEFVHTHCDEIQSINEKVFPDNDYSVQLKKRLQQITLKNQRELTVNNKSSTISSGSVVNDKLIDNLCNESSRSSKCNDFNFNLVYSLSNDSDNLDSENESFAEQILNSNNTFINPNWSFVNYEPDTKIKFGTPNATSTIKHQQTQCVSIFPTQNDKPNFVGKCNKRITDGKKYNKKKSLSEFNSNNKKNTQEFPKTDDQKSCEKYSAQLKKRLQQITLKHQRELTVNNKVSTISSGSVVNDKLINNLCNESSRSSKCNDFNFNPVYNLSNDSDTGRSQLSPDSFINATQETFTNIDDSLDIGQVELDVNEEYVSSLEVHKIEKKEKHCRRVVTSHYKSESTNVTCYKSTYQTIKYSVENKSPDFNFKYYKKKMF